MVLTLDNDEIAPYDNLQQSNFLTGEIEELFRFCHDQGNTLKVVILQLIGAISQEWGMPGTPYEGNFNNSIFALMGGYNTEGYDGESDFSIRTL